jgi:hypothetical protein
MFGMVSDTLSIVGYSRSPYIALAGALGTFSFLVLGSASLSILGATLFMIGVNFSVASPDVMIDAVVAEKCKMHPAFASDLQSLCWGSMALFSALGYATSGLLIRSIGPVGTFLLLSLSSLLVLLPAVLGFLGESRRPSHPAKQLFHLDLSRFREHKTLFHLAIFVSSCAVSLTVIVLSVDIWLYRLIAVVLVAGLVSSSVYASNRKAYPQIANLALLIFLRESLTPDIETTMFYWYLPFSFPLSSPHLTHLTAHLIR